MPKTELIWEGKYDPQGNRVPVPRVELPFQTVETVNEPAAERKTLWSAIDAEKPWRNRLIWGDKKYVLPSLLPEFAGKVDLIYIDPPFDTGADFSFTANIPGPPDDEDDAAAFTKLPSVIELKAYRDTWGRGLDSYLHWFSETAVLLHELLAETGSLYVHLGPEIGHYAKCILDDVFGDGFRNEVIWKRTTSHSDAKGYGAVHEVIYFYTKRPSVPINEVLQEYDQEYLDSYYRYVDEDGKKFMSADLTGAGGGPPRMFGERGMIAPPAGRHWMYDQEGIDRALREKRIFWTRNGVPRLKKYASDARGMRATDLWDDIQPVRSWHREEAANYPTQKPEALLERIIRASSNEGDLVLDCVCGSGTTAVAAEKLGRRWIAADLGRFAVHTTRKRLLAIPGVKPFVVQNLGRYERQRWLTGRFAPDGPETPEAADRRHREYIDFMLGLYHAQPVRGYSYLHGKKGDRFVHVGGVDGPVTNADIKNLAIEFRKAVGGGKDAPATNGIDVLGWDFAFEQHEVAAQQAKAANIHLKFKRIPRDVMDKRAVEQGDIPFFELAALGATAAVTGNGVTVELTEFVIPPDDVPQEVQQAVRHWSQWIDFWAVDWSYAGDSFHNEWQAFRTRKNPKLPLSTTHTYPGPGEYRILVKVIDILGNDTTKTLAVSVGAPDAAQKDEKRRPARPVRG
jgi:DNA modification methylase